MAYPSSIVASTLAKPSFLEYMGVGDERGIYSSKKRLVGTITALFQVSRLLFVTINFRKRKGKEKRADTS